MRPVSATLFKTLLSVLSLVVLLSATNPLHAQQSTSNGADATSNAESAPAEPTVSGKAASPSINPTSELERQKKVITVAEGDTLTTISQAEFGTRSFWRHIAEFNQIAAEDVLQPGQIVLIPTLTTVPRQYALVVFTHGSAMRLETESAAPVELLRDDKIFPGNVIETTSNGFASISFQNGSVVNLQPDTRFKLLNLACSESDKTCFIDINAPIGEMTTDVESLNNQNTHLRVKTPHATAAVRGTQFDLASNGSQLLLGVTDGLVAVSAEGSEVDLEAGFGSRTLANQPPGEPIPLLHQPTYTNIPPRLAITDRIGWWEVSGAANYEWIISSDASSTNVIEKQASTEQFAEIGTLAPGDYYLQVRALDDNGLKGFANTEKFSVAEIVSSSATPVTLSYTRTGREILIGVQDPDPAVGGYEIQIASTETFIDTISIDVGPSGEAYFSEMNRKVFLRARALLSPREVSEFGPSLQTD